VANAILQTVNSPLDMYGNTPLHLAVSHNDYTLSFMLLLKGADPKTSNRSGVTPTVLAKRLGFSKILKLLLHHGGVVPASEEREKISFQKITGRRNRRYRPAKSETNNHPQHRRASSAPVEFSSPMQPKPPAPSPLKTQPNASIPEEDQSKPAASTQAFSLDSESTNTRAEDLSLWFDIALKLSASLPSPQSLPVYNAAYLGQSQTLITALKTPQLCVKDKKGFTVLMKASYRGHLDLVKFLVQKQVDVDATDSQGLTALSWAAVAGHLDVVKCLLEEGHAQVDGAALDMSPDLGSTNTVSGSPSQIPTPLLAASFYGHQNIVEYLVEKGADVNRQFGPQSSPRSILMISSWGRKEAIVKYLVAVGAELDKEIDAWLTQGLLRMKRMSVEHSSFDYDGDTLAATTTPVSTTLPTSPSTTTLTSASSPLTLTPSTTPSSTIASQVSGSSTLSRRQRRLSSVREKLLILTSEDTEIISTYRKLLQEKTQAEKAGDTQTQKEITHTPAPQARQRNQVIVNTNRYRQGLNLDVCLLVSYRKKKVNTNLHKTRN
jgi:ankyrin repeat protein